MGEPSGVGVPCAWGFVFAKTGKRDAAALFVRMRIMMSESGRVFVSFFVLVLFFYFFVCVCYPDLIGTLFTADHFVRRPHRGARTAGEDWRGVLWECVPRDRLAERARCCRQNSAG